MSLSAAVSTSVRVASRKLLPNSIQEEQRDLLVLTVGQLTEIISDIFPSRGKSKTWKSIAHIDGMDVRSR